ncbi:MAG: molybdate ABC transporter substrate-binding protein [Planctomycetaceae bacterium]
MRAIGGTLLLILMATVCGCGQSSPIAETTTPVRSVVSVAAAADLKYALDDLTVEFARSHPQIEVRPTYGSSGNFYAQLSNKAPFDIYFSADIDYPRKLIEQGHADKETEFLYAVGQIVVWVRNESLLDVESLGVRALVEPGVRKVAIANPQHAPYGRAAEAALKQLGVYEQVQDRLVLGENIAQTAQFVESGAADVGVIALSLAMAPALREQGRYWIVPLGAYPRLEQGGAILTWAKDREATDALRTFVIGDAGRAILRRYGFLLPGE